MLYILNHRLLVALDDGEGRIVFVGRDALLVFGHHLQLHVVTNEDAGGTGQQERRHLREFQNSSAC